MLLASQQFCIVLPDDDTTAVELAVNGNDSDSEKKRKKKKKKEKNKDKDLNNEDDTAADKDRKKKKQRVFGMLRDLVESVEKRVSNKTDSVVDENT